MVNKAYQSAHVCDHTRASTYGMTHACIALQPQSITAPWPVVISQSR